MIDWQEIADIGAYAMPGQRMLGVELIDPQAVFARVRPVKRLTLQINSRLVPVPVNIPRNVLPMPVERLEEELSVMLRSVR